MNPSDELAPQSYTQKELDEAYDQSRWAPNMAQVVARYASESERLRPLCTVETLRYGRRTELTLDFFPAAAAGAPLVIFLHGGAWRGGNKESYRFIGHAVSTHGSNCAVVDFSPAQEVGLPGMVEQVAEAVVYLDAEADHLRVNQQRVVIMGHSSGAHLAACLLAGAGEQPREILKGGFLIAGIYDLDPVRRSWRNNYLSLSTDDSTRFSPLLHADRIGVPLILAYGAAESPEFKRQSREFGMALNRIGRLKKSVEITNRNHFELLLDLVDGGEMLNLLLEVVGLPSRTQERQVEVMSCVPRRRAMTETTRGNLSCNTWEPTRSCSIASS